MSSLLLVTVGEDFTTFSGKDVIPVQFDKARKFVPVQILIRDDLVDENTEWFSAELQSSSCNSSTTVSIIDNPIVICSFQQREYFVYEYTRNATLTLNSSRSLPLDFHVVVGVIYGTGNASGE